jgi:hypothetical protein
VTDVGGVIVTVSVADIPGSATAVAVIIAVALLATLAGASYSTDVLVCLLRAPGPESFHVTPLADGSFETTAVMVTDCPCAMVCELPPLKLMESTGGGVLAPPPQPERIVVLRYPHAIKAIHEIFFCPCMTTLPNSGTPEMLSFTAVPHRPGEALPDQQKQFVSSVRRRKTSFSPQG